MGNRAHLARVRFQRAGAGHRPAEAWVDLSVVADPRAEIERRQGPLAHFELADPEPAASETATEAALARLMGAGTPSRALERGGEAVASPVLPVGKAPYGSGAAWGTGP